MQKKVLIVCWLFPPHFDIGGRRWAKFAKYLQLNGFEIHVLTNKLYDDKENFQWIKKEDAKNFNYHFVKQNIFSKWLNVKQHYFSSIKFRLAKFILSMFNKGTIYDMSIAIEKNFNRIVENIIFQNNIDSIIVSGAPFNLFYYATLIKVKNPNINLICDFRDPWLNAQNYGMKTLNNKRKLNEEDKFNQVISFSNFITAPNRFMLDEIFNLSKLKVSKKKLVELPHAFDPDDVLSLKPKTKAKDSISIVYGGAFYVGCEPWLNLLNESIMLFNSKYQLQKIELKIYTPDVTNFKACFINNKNVLVSGPIGKIIFEEISSSDCVLILLSDHNKNYVTSKFFEFLPYRKPYMYVGPQGFVSDKIVSEGLGFVLHKPDDFLGFLNSNFTKAFSPQMENYTFDYVTKNVLAKLI